MSVSYTDLVAVQATYWPQVSFYGKQLDVIESTVESTETYVTAGNKLGKDYVTGFIALGCFIVCQQKDISCRIVTTSVAEKHLDILWGEIGRFITTAQFPLLDFYGGKLTLNSMEIRRREEALAKKPYNYLKGIVFETAEKLAGHHADFTLGIGDEASGLGDGVYEMFQGWAKHMLFIGNPNSTQNFFKKGVKGGDLLAT